MEEDAGLSELLDHWQIGIYILPTLDPNMHTTYIGSSLLPSFFLT